jgi:hypothetical protein
MAPQASEIAQNRLGDVGVAVAGQEINQATFGATLETNPRPKAGEAGGPKSSQGGGAKNLRKGAAKELK